MKKEKGNAQTISQIMNLSQSTVSKALNNCGSVDSQTKEAILKTAQDLEYTPAQKKRVKQRSTGFLVGVVMPINPYYFWNPAILGMQAAESSHQNLHVVFSLFANLCSEKDALYCLDYLEDLQIDLLIITPPAFASVQQKLAQIAGRIPVVCFNETADFPFLFYTGSDFYRDGVRLADACANLLFTHADILKITYGSPAMVSQRDEGFRRRITLLAPKARWVGTVDTRSISPSSFSAQLARILHEKYDSRFQAVYVSQGMLPQVCLAIRKLKLPEKIVVVGYENPEKNTQYMQSGMIAALLAQDTYTQGVRCIEAAYAYLSGGLLPEDHLIYIDSRIWRFTDQ